ncbi:MAG: N-acetyltransferase [Erysipelotrichaceae bacterium]|nr:N-acetyltransferase [Erysipelotrichaceae bacterium]
MRVRIAAAEDAKLLSELRIAQLHDEETQPDIEISEAMEDWFLKKLSDGSLYQVLLYEEEELLATGCLYVLEMPPSFHKPTGKVGYIGNMYTLPAHRKKGYATKVLSLLKEEAEKRDMDRLFLGASVYGAPVYEAFGFRKCDQFMSLDLKKIS